MPAGKGYQTTGWLPRTLPPLHHTTRHQSHPSALRNSLKALLIGAIRLLPPPALAELGALLGDADLQRDLGELAPVALVTELLGSVMLLEADGDDAVLLFVEEGDVGDGAELLGFFSHVILDLEVGVLVGLELGKGEGVLDDNVFLPLALGGGVGGCDDFCFVVGPFGELAERL